MNHKNPIIDVIKGLAILLVVYGHVIQNSMTVAGEDFFFNPAFKVIYTFHMPLFVLLSGYLMGFSLNKRSVSDVFKSRCQSLLVPFVVWGVLGAITGYILKISNPSVWLVWFLYTLFVSSCLLLASVALEKKWGKGVFAGIYLLLLVIPCNEYFFLYYIKWFYLFYLAGYGIQRWNITITNRSIHAVVLGVSLAFFCLLLPFWNRDDYIYVHHMNFLTSDYAYELLRMLYRYVIGFLGIIIACYVGMFLAGSPVRSVLSVMGVYALDIYLIQRYLVEGIYPRVLANTSIHFNFQSPLFLYIEAPLMALLFVSLCILISKLCIRKFPILNQLLLGGRHV